MQVKKITPLRRSSVVVNKFANKLNGLVNSPSNNSLDPDDQKNTKLLENKYKHVSKDLKQARGEINSKGGNFSLTHAG